MEYKEDDVRSSELETGLSSNAESLSKAVDTATLKLPSSSSSPLVHALSETCSLKESHLTGFRKRFHFLKALAFSYLGLVRRLVTLLIGKCAFMK